MLDTSQIKEKIIDAALKCGEQQAWSAVTLRDIAQRADVSLSELSLQFQSKREILTAFTKCLDRAVLQQVEADANAHEEIPRDRLFDVLMTRFELMQPYKPALKSIVKDIRKTNQLSYVSMSQLFGSQNWMLIAAAISAEGVTGKFRIVGLAKIYLDVFYVWLEDDDAGLSKTMAALDKKLRSGEAWIKRADSVLSEGSAIFNRLFHRRRTESANAE